MSSVETLQRALGYRFRDAALLERALTHRSAAGDHNERLEFLGDSLLNFAVASAVYDGRPRADEGELSRLRALLVREPTLAQAARRIALGDHLRLGPGELKSGGFRRDSILADGVEALLGAALLDGGVEVARKLCLHLLAEELASLSELAAAKDAKTRLQERLQAGARPLPLYVVIGEEGPAHARTFRVRCRLPDATDETSGEGLSRKLAEQQAAERMLEKLEGAASHA